MVASRLPSSALDVNLPICISILLKGGFYGPASTLGKNLARVKYVLGVYIFKKISESQCNSFIVGYSHMIDNM